MARIDYDGQDYLGRGTFTERLIWKDNGFTLCKTRKGVWIAPSLQAALEVPGVTWTDEAATAAGVVMEVRSVSKFMSYKGTTAFEPPYPQGVKDKGWAPKPFQCAGVEYSLGRKDTLIADQPGLGKTIMATLVANCLPSITQVLVVVPASLKENWRREWKTWQTGDLTVGIAEASFVEKEQDGFYKNGKPKFRNVTRRNVWPDTQVVIINYEILERFTEQINGRVWDMLVCDECHALKTEFSNRSLFVLGGNQPADRKKGRPKAIWWKAVDARKRVFLSGTPLLNRPYEFWPIVRAFDPLELGADQERFIYRYCGGYRTHHGLDHSGATNLAELGQKVREKFMIRRLKRDVLPELPPKTRMVVTLDSKEIRDLVARESELAEALGLFEAMVNASEADQVAQGDQILERAQAMRLDKALGMAPDAGAEEPEPNAKLLKMDYAMAVSGLEPPAVSIAFEEIASVRRELGIAKLSAVIPWVKDFLDGGEKLVLFAYHTDVVKALIEALAKYNPAFIYGGVPQRQRQGMVDKFQQDETCRVIIGNIHAMGVGHTLTRASDVAFAEQDWTPTLMEQCEDRVLRIGQTADKVFAFYLVANGSLDCRIAQSAKEKEDNINMALDL